MAVFVVLHENSISEYADMIYHMESGRLRQFLGTVFFCPRGMTNNRQFIGVIGIEIDYSSMADQIDYMSL